MHQYLNLLKEIIDNGERKNDRTQTGTLSIFGPQMRFDLSEGFPLVTTKKVHLKSIIHELLWFLRGETNIRSLQEAGVSIWNEWADENGDLGPVYGKQWRAWDDGNGSGSGKGEGHSIDQISEALRLIKKDPDSRRIIVSSWNVGELNKMALAPCHCFFQLYVSNGCLSCQLYQRSADVFLGVPFNIASYALLTLMMAQVSNLKPGFFVHTMGDAHLYLNHLEQAELQLTRKPFPLPKMILNKNITSLFDFRYEDFSLENYECHARIAAPVAV